MHANVMTADPYQRQMAMNEISIGYSLISGTSALRYSTPSLTAIATVIIVALQITKTIADDTHIQNSIGSKYLPAWEVGVDAAVTKLPAYPASATTALDSYYIPWFVYRNGRLSVEEEGFTLNAISQDRFSLDISMTGALNASTEDVPVRTGMPDIDYLVELGPMLEYRFFDKTIENESWYGFYASSGLGATMSTDFSDLQFQGLVFTSDLSLYYERYSYPVFDLSMGIGMRWMSESMMDYLYQVDPAYVLDDRPLYDAKGGYLGSNVNIEISRLIKRNMLTYGGLILDLHQNARNYESPLFENKNNFGVYVGVNWAIMSSKRMVPAY